MFEGMDPEVRAVEGRRSSRTGAASGRKWACTFRGPHGVLVRDVLGLKSGGGGWVVVLRKNCGVRGEASGPGLEAWSWGPRGLHPRSQCSQHPRRARFRVRTTRPWGVTGAQVV